MGGRGFLTGLTTRGLGFGFLSPNAIRQLGLPPKETVEIFKKRPLGHTDSTIFWEITGFPGPVSPPGSFLNRLRYVANASVANAPFPYCGAPEGDDRA
jgi:hypothetical protein